MLAALHWHCRRHRRRHQQRTAGWHAARSEQLLLQGAHHAVPRQSGSGAGAHGQGPAHAQPIPHRRAASLRWVHSIVPAWPQETCCCAGTWRPGRCRRQLALAWTATSMLGSHLGPCRALLRQANVPASIIQVIHRVQQPLKIPCSRCAAS